MKKADLFFKFSFFFILLVMAITFSSNIEKRSPQISRAGVAEKIIFEKIDTDKIKKFIDENRLSDKEAMFYKIIEK